MTYRILGVLMFTFVSLASQAQVNPLSNTIRWTATGLTDLSTNETVAHSCQFITYGNQKLDWIQDSGKYTTHWTITGTSGAWADGNLVFNITDGEQTGSITVSKSSSGITVGLKINGTLRTINFSYTISSYEKL